MKNCEYYIKASGEHFDSYTKLLEWVDSLKLEEDLDKWLKLSDLVFSVSPKLDLIVKLLLDKSKDYLVGRNSRTTISAIIDGEPDLTSQSAFNINEFLESDLCQINGKRIVTKLNPEEYKENQIEKFIGDKDKPKMSRELAEQEFEKILKHNDIISEDAAMLHSLLTSSLVVSDKSSASLDFAELFRKAQTTRFEGNSIISDQLFNGLKRSFVQTVSDYPNSRVVKNLNLKSKLNGIGQDLIGHIDYLYVDLDGTLHLYNFKVSSQHYSQWPSAKVEKYKAQLVFLKYMLAENGLNVLNIDLNIIPILIEYNNDASKARSIRVFNPLKYSANQYKGGEYALEHYDQLISKFLKDNYIPSGISNDAITRATEDIRKIFPSLNIHEDGIKKTAEEWIKNAPDCDPYDIEPLVIEDVHMPDHGYNLIVRKKDGSTETIVIKSDKTRNNNKELLEKVKQHLQYLSDNKGYLLNTIKNAVKEGYAKGTSNVFSGQRGLPPIFLGAIFNKYFKYHIDPKDPDKKRKIYDWEILEDLSLANILMYRNVKTNLVDIISLSSFNLNISPKLKRGSSVLGDYRYDTQTPTFKGDFGNIELIRTMSLLNLVVSSLTNLKLGKVLVINTLSQTLRSYSASYLNRSLFSEVLNVIGKEHLDNPIKNNLKSCRFVDEVNALISEYTSITESMSDEEKDIYESLGFSVLDQISADLREYALYNIMDSIYRQFPEFGEERGEELVIKTAENGTDPKSRNFARLLLLTSQAYLAVRGELVLHQSTLASLDTLTFTAMTVPDSNIAIVANNLLITHDTISLEFMEQFQPMLKVFEEFFDEVGYSRALGVTIGNEASLFSNLYDSDSDLMKFKNPYDQSNDLTDPERKLLKKVLLAINRITSGERLEFESYNDHRIPEYIKKHLEYLWVPLEKASKATMRLKLSSISTAMKYTRSLLTNSKERFESTINKMLSEEADMLDEGFSLLLLKNTFSLSMPIGGDFSTTEKSRRKLLKRGKDFYETNLKNIFIDYLFKSISTEQYNKLLIGSKALLLSLHLTGDYGGNEEAVNKEIEYIKDYLKVNVFQRSIMEPKSRKVMSVVAPVKSKVTDMLLMGNVVSFLRDSIQGVLENTTRSIIKMNTNITPQSVAKAYAYVTTHSTSDARAVNLLSKLCLRYRLSNTDVGRISERAKSARNGIFNWDNWAYGTLRSPDFLNRMTLFVSKCMEDGCWEAWDVDSDGNLIYDWKKDKRFNLLANKDTRDKEAYAKQRSLYISKLREYNLEHPGLEELELSTETDLPTPYSNKEILSIRSVADNIYGSYDKSKKGMYENWALGVALGSFTTWFNGIYNNYFAKPGQYATSKLKQVLDTDMETGLPLYFDPATGNITTNPVGEDGSANDVIWKNVPIITQGIFPTIGTLWKVYNNDGLDGVKEYLHGNEGEKANLRKLLSDLIATILFSILFGSIVSEGVLTTKYKNYKREMKENPLVLNLVTELLFKSSSRSYDSFMGPINIILQLGSKMDPPYYSVPIKLLLDSYSTVFGEKLFNALMFDNFGFTRAYKDSFRAELKK